MVVICGLKIHGEKLLGSAFDHEKKSVRSCSKLKTENRKGFGYVEFVLGATARAFGGHAKVLIRGREVEQRLLNSSMRCQKSVMNGWPSVLSNERFLSFGHGIGYQEQSGLF